jgi:hypothetical protein
MTLDAGKMAEQMNTFQTEGLTAISVKIKRYLLEWETVQFFTWVSTCWGNIIPPSSR